MAFSLPAGNGPLEASPPAPAGKTASPATGVHAIAAGGRHSAAVMGDRSVRGWGANEYGQLGIGGALQGQVKDLSNITAVAADNYYSAALRRDGTVWTWGQYYPQAADPDRLVPSQVEGVSNITALAAGSYYTLALRRDGTVWGWGDSSSGQLGHGEKITTAGKVPVRVKGITQVTAIAASGMHSAAVRRDGTLWSWGYNSHGQLGDGSTTQRLKPVQVKGLRGC